MRKSKTIKQQSRYYGFDFVEQLENTLICGNFSNAKELFKELKRSERKEAINQMNSEECKSFYFNLM